MSTDQTTPVEPTAAPMTTAPIDKVPNETAPGIPESQRKAMEELPPNHTYRDRVEAQARALGVKIEDDWTLERLMFEIRMQASA